MFACLCPSAVFLTIPPQHLNFSPSSVLPDPEYPHSYPFSFNSRAGLSGTVLVSELLYASIAWLFLAEDTPAVGKFGFLSISLFHDSSRVIVLSEVAHI